MVTQKILELGLANMSKETRKERIDRIFMEDNNIDGAALAALIDECRDGMRVLLTGNEGQISNPDEVRAMLDEVDGKNAVANMSGEEIVEMLMELREST